MKSIYFISLLAAIMVLGIGCTQTQTNDPIENESMEKTDEVNIVNDNTIENESINEDEVMMKQEEPSEEVSVSEEEINEEIDTVTAGSYIAYDANTVTQAATNGDAILFFHAGWCPTCKALDSDIQANLAQIPAGVTIFKTNYDTETELKKKYGVTYQHTLVQVDADGNMITKWSGGNTLDSVINKVQ